MNRKRTLIVIASLTCAILIGTFSFLRAQETRPETQPETRAVASTAPVRSLSDAVDAKGLPETRPETLPETQETQPIALDMPDFVGIDQWLNSVPLTKASLQGKVVLIDFWTYSCVNCLRTLPHLKAWYQKYHRDGLIVIGVHSPEFDFEKDAANVKMAVEKLQIPYPVALDSQMLTWNAFKVEAWPAHYLIDRKGKIRDIHLGESGYDETEKLIQKLIAENQSETQPSPESQKFPESRPLPETQATKMVTPETKPAPETAPSWIKLPKKRKHKLIPETQKTETQPSTLPTTMPTLTSETKPETTPSAIPSIAIAPYDIDFSQIKSPETYLGFLRRERLVTSGRPLEINEWAYEGKWRTEGERIVLNEGTGKIRFRFSATRVNLVLHPGTSSVKATIRLDGVPVTPEKSGRDTKDGSVWIREPRMYELINLGPQGSEHTIEIEFLSPGVAAYAFTFG